MGDVSPRNPVGLTGAASSGSLGRRSRRHQPGITMVRVRVATRLGIPDVPCMNEIIARSQPVPAEWLDIIAESEADFAARRIVPGEEVMRDLREGLARLEAKREVKQTNKPRL
jgi:hypothetical protein